MRNSKKEALESSNLVSSPWSSRISSVAKKLRKRDK